MSGELIARIGVTISVIGLLLLAINQSYIKQKPSGENILDVQERCISDPIAQSMVEKGNTNVSLACYIYARMYCDQWECWPRESKQ